MKFKYDIIVYTTHLYFTTSAFQYCLHISVFTQYFQFLIDLYYCQKDLADHEFENFCERFLQDISLRKLNADEPAVGRIFLVLELPSKNRQNNVDVLSEDIEDIIKKHLLKGKC